MLNVIKRTGKVLFLPLSMFAISFLLYYYQEKIFHKLLFLLHRQVIVFIEVASQILIASTIAWSIDACVKLFLWEIFLKDKFGFEVPKIIKQLVSVFIIIICILLVINIVFKQSLSGLAITSGSLGLVLGLALQNLLSDIFAGLVINLDKTFQVGQMIILPSLSKFGRVKEITWRTTVLELDKNSFYIMPNSLVSAMAVVNLSSNTIKRNFFTISFDESASIEKVIKNALDILNSIKGVLFDPEPEVLISNYSNNGTEYKIVYWVDESKEGAFAVKQEFMKKISEVMKISDLKSSIPKKIVYDDNYQSKKNFGFGALNLVLKCKVFKDYSKEIKNQLFEKSIKHTLDINTCLVNTTDKNDSLYIVLDGLINYKETPDSTSIKIFMPGDFFGAVSMLTDVHLDFEAVAKTSVVILELKSSDFFEVIGKDSGSITPAAKFLYKHIKRSKYLMNKIFEDRQIPKNEQAIGIIFNLINQKMLSGKNEL